MELPSDPESKRLLLTSLAAFSDACLPGSLTPTCPFFEQTDSGPACGEQCQDILAEHGRGVDATRFDLGADLVAIRIGRPRARRGPSPTTRPYDASEVALRQRNVPTRQKSSAALLNDVKRLATTPPWQADDPEDRAYSLRASLDELARRGLPADLVVRDGLAEAITGGLAVALTFSDLLSMNDGPRDTEHFVVAEAPPGWMAALSGEAAPPTDPLARVSAVFMSFARLVAWIDLAPLEEILDMSAPAALPDQPPRTRSDRAKGIWLVDRFCETYPVDWRQEALQCEWNYLHGLEVGCCPPQIMAERRLAADVMGATIADIAVNEWRHREPDEHQAVTIDSFTPLAVDHLERGDTESAQSLFRSLVSVRPGSATAHNNLGFCLIPDDVDQALIHLREAERLGFAGPAVNLANQVLCLFVRGEYDEAVALGERMLSETDSEEAGYVWLRDGDHLSFSGPLVLRSYVDDLVNEARLRATEG